MKSPSDVSLTQDIHFLIAFRSPPATRLTMRGLVMAEPNTRYDLPPDPPRRSVGDIAFRIVMVITSWVYLAALWSGKGWAKVAGPICLAAAVVLGTVLFVKSRRNGQSFWSQFRD